MIFSAVVLEFRLAIRSFFLMRSASSQSELDNAPLVAKDKMTLGVIPTSPE